MVFRHMQRGRAVCVQHKSILYMHGIYLPHIHIHICAHTRNLTYTSPSAHLYNVAWILWWWIHYKFLIDLIFIPLQYLIFRYTRISIETDLLQINFCLFHSLSFMWLIQSQVSFYLLNGAAKCQENLPKSPSLLCASWPEVPAENHLLPYTLNEDHLTHNAHLRQIHSGSLSLPYKQMQISFSLGFPSVLFCLSGFCLSVSRNIEKGEQEVKLTLKQL